MISPLDPKINRVLKNFKPDCGILSVEAAVEFKMVHTMDEVAKAISGVFEDIAGYSGSKEWTRFYSVFYQAQPFILEAHIRQDLKRAGATDWTPILVNGPATLRKKRATKPKTTVRKKTVR